MYVVSLFVGDSDMDADADKNLSEDAKPGHEDTQSLLVVYCKSRSPRFKVAGAGGRQRQLPPKKWLFYRNYHV